jgi:predicted  nucleic acid-binding Zn-ribbon protein
MPPRKTDPLIPLQDLDLQIHKLKVQRAEKPRQLASAEKKVAHAKDNLSAVQAEIKALKLEAAKRELTVKEHDAKAEKLQMQSMTAKKNDEYQAFQKEISGVKADKLRVEDGLLDLMMQSEEKGKLEKLRQEELKTAEDEHAVAKKKLEAEMVVDDRDIRAQLAKRNAIATTTEKEIIRVYERVLAAKDDGIGLAGVSKYEVIEDEGKVVYWQCEPCGVGLNMQDVNLLMMGREIQLCRNCSRIMYLRTEPAAPPAAPKA